MKRTVKILVPAVFWVLIWAVLAQIVGQTFLLPDPATVAVRLWELGGLPFFGVLPGQPCCAFLAV